MNNMFNSVKNDILEKIKTSDKIYIMSHIDPDGDSIGSILGLGLSLNRILNKDINIAVNDDIPSNFEFLPIKHIGKINSNDKIDLLITLDCADIGRLGFEEDFLNNIKYIINIDHHVTNTNFGDINIVNHNASSTCEVVYELLEEMNIGLTVDIATCLYVGISTDTGSFKYGNTSSRTHLIASNLLEKGIDIGKINTELYQKRSVGRTKLLMESLNNLELLNNDKVAIVSLTSDMFDRCNSSKKDADSIVDFIRDISTVEVACVLKEVDYEKIKISLRSKEYVDVSKIATEFEGGGHSKASGCTIFSNIEEAKEKILKKILEAI
ncbi:bifunctional oligoribonuclease and PAP phosphatase NrnA [Gottschalkia purinilytica]|uniref:Bifunctional oligoribonuclease and PAP phosphatase NrnA n=1 Tax=Gottschalkia purinilytica TaxID=1503 RepID=A0A0L0WBF9_GOTPU|nr:bifunctional oligoribonuclease/PAP phosphatase NrnA [Gottschalkia purinilytica]KNF08864.1 bifunctional oligoribonuclease and PAP phosphatase NrnA [Gottschalkia purinilytica]